MSYGESTPLLFSYPKQGNSTNDNAQPRDEFSQTANRLGRNTPGETGGKSIDEVSLASSCSSFRSVADDVPMVKCGVCHEMIDITGKRQQQVVRCLSCNEITPIKRAPPGRKYVRCTCNCLLICNRLSQKIACPRPDCKRITSLTVPNRPTSYIPQGIPGLCRVTCGYCHESFLSNFLTNSLERCPHCRKLSSIGGNIKNKKGCVHLCLGVITLIITVGITAGTAANAEDKGGLYVVYIVLFLLTALLFYRGYYYLTIKVSPIDRPLQET